MRTYKTEVVLADEVKRTNQESMFLTIELEDGEKFLDILDWRINELCKKLNKVCISWRTEWKAE